MMANDGNKMGKDNENRRWKLALLRDESCSFISHAGDVIMYAADYIIDGNSFSSISYLIPLLSEYSDLFFRQGDIRLDFLHCIANNE